MASSEVKNAYGREYMDELVNGIKNAGTWCAPSLDPVIDAMVDAILSETPRYRYLIDGSKKAFDKFCVSDVPFFTFHQTCRFLNDSFQLNGVYKHCGESAGDPQCLLSFLVQNLYRSLSHFVSYVCRFFSCRQCRILQFNRHTKVNGFKYLLKV